MTITMQQKKLGIGGVWMILQDARKLAKLMVIQEVTQRELAHAAGWRAHSYLQRLLKGDAKNVEPEPAARIANYLGVGVDDLFLVKVDTSNGHLGHSGKIANRKKVA